MNHELFEKMEIDAQYLILESMYESLLRMCDEFLDFHSSFQDHWDIADLCFLIEELKPGFMEFAKACRKELPF